MGSDLARHLEQRLADRAALVTEAWADVLTRRAEADPGAVLSARVVREHGPTLVRELARQLGTGAAEEPFGPAVRGLVGPLADAGRRQGASVDGLLAEFTILSRLIDAEILAAVAECDGPAAPDELARLVALAKDAVFVLAWETAGRYRAWAVRRRQERLRVLEGYTAMLSHELGNRLGAAETAVRLLMAEPVLTPERRRRLNELILNSVRNGIDTVQAVSALFRARDDAGRGERRRLPLDAVLSDAVHQLRVGAADRGIRLRLAGTVSSDPIDAERFPLVLYNLVSNAIRHHDRPGGRGEVAIAVVREPDRLVVSITDDGPGIAPELRDRIFEPQVRGNRTEEGGGLGLAIAREAVEQMGGTIELAAGQGRGAVFRFTMPVADRPEPRPGDRTPG